MRSYLIVSILLFVITASGKSVRWLGLTAKRLSTPTKVLDTADNRVAKTSQNRHIPTDVAQLLPALSSLSFMILATTKCDASPLIQQQYVPLRGPFFQGWLIRCIDHDRNTSFIVIAGSFSRSGTIAYTENYLFAAVNSPSVSTHEELLMSEEAVTVTSTPAATGQQPLNLVWDAGLHGQLTFSDDSCTGSLNLNGRLSLWFNITDRLRWSGFAGAGQLSSLTATDGPEGWLGMAAMLLPCHYSVHSVGSRCRYEIATQAPPARPGWRGLWTRIGKYCAVWISVNGRSMPSIGGGVIWRTCTVSGEGYAHIEGNHGQFFPSGWIWSHAIAANNSASFSLALGKFTIAGLTPTTGILYLRTMNGRPVVFRTTDLDYIRYATDRTTGTLELNATSLFKNRRLSLVIRPAGNATEAFKTRVQVPTAGGFRNRPGCLETYTAKATISLSKLVGGGEDNSQVYEFPLTALEYGGSFIKQHLGM